MGEKVSGWLQEQMKENGISVRTQINVEEFQQQKDGQLVIKTDQGNLTTDIAILAFGFVPNTVFVQNELETSLDGLIV